VARRRRGRHGVGGGELRPHVATLDLLRIGEGRGSGRSARAGQRG
jgi:hypothetical protein